MPVPTSNHDPSSSSDLLGDWDDMPSHSSYASGTTEFFAEVELWQSAKSSVLRKVSLFSPLLNLILITDKR
jgi:hypothetical protein